MEQAPADGTLWEIPSVNIDATDSWSSHYACRRDVAARFGDIFSLPLAKRARDVLSRQVGESALVLEVGAGDRRMAEKLRAGRGGLTYESMDIDPCGNHDYSDLSKIDRQYDVIFAFEVLEHIDVDELGPFLSQVAGLVREGGSLVLSTPNTWYPPAYLRDITHRTPLPYDELGALVQRAGLHVSEIYRVYHDPVHRRLLRQYLFGWVFQMMGIDYARQIVLVAERPAAAARKAA